MATDDLPVDEEHFESIPWSSLVAQTDSRPWLVYVAAGAVVALVVGLLVARSFPPTSTTAPTVPVAPLATPPIPPTTSVAEADLRAELVPSPVGESAAATRAEWFVTDFFTGDGAGGRQAELVEALGRPVTHAEPDLTTYVEWARAWSTELETDGRFRVSVAFRAITDTESGFVRGPVQGVAVRVQVGPEGGTRVVDLPEPISLPPPPALVEPPAVQPVPDAIADRALEVAAGWGESASVVDGVVVAGTWRVSVEVVDENGLRWPMVVWLEDTEEQWEPLQQESLP